MSKFSTWINLRLPIQTFWKQHFSGYMVPKNLNFWYLFGVFSLVVLLNQIITGIVLSMYYTPTAREAFQSIEHIMRDVPFGWLIRYLHTTGASAFFAVIYLHMYRGIMYGSYKAPREIVWLLGMLIFLLLMVEAATGYALPWGQMSYWAVKVLISVFSVIPWLGKAITVWLQGDYTVSGVTLHRFFSFHVIAFPLALIAIVGLHLVALHHVGSNNPDGTDLKRTQSSLNASDSHLNRNLIPFFPYYVVKDLIGVIIFLMIFLSIVFYAPTMGGYFIEHANAAPANPLITPSNIAPPWYLAPFYAMLRAIPNKTFGVIVSAAAVAVLFVLPWLDRSRVRSIRYKGKISKIAITLFVISFSGLGFFGTQPLSDSNILICRALMLLYFLFFMAMPWYTQYEQTKPLPTEQT